MRLVRKIKDKFDEIAIKAYVKWTVFIWQVEDYMNELVSDLKKIVKLGK